MKEKTFGIKEPTKEYGERVGVYGIGFNKDGKIQAIMTHLNNGEEGYFLLGSGIENNESHCECIKRECMEEAELRVGP